MNCKDCALLLLDFHFDTLDGPRRAEVAEHLLSCPDCRATLEKLKHSVPDQLSWPDEEPPADLTTKLLARVEHAKVAAAIEAVDLPAPRQRRSATTGTPVRTVIKVAAAIAFISVAGWAFAVHQQRAAIAISVDGQQRLSPGGLATLRAQVFDIDTQEPISGARLRVLLRGPDGSEHVIYEGPSDQWGTLSAGRRLPDLPEGGYTLVVHAARRGDETRVEQPITIERRYRVMLSTDKPTYQPGQVIHARALVRESATNRPPDGAPITFTVVDAKGNKVGRKTEKLDRFGVASFDFTLADEILLGGWRIEADVKGAASAADVSVARYTLPKFAVTVTTDKPWYRPGEVVSGRVETRYFFGKPAGGAKAKLTAGVFVDKFRPVAETSGTADEAGVMGFEFVLPPSLPGMALLQGSAAVDLALEIEDRAGQRVEKHHAITVAAEPMSVTAVAEGGSLAVGLESKVLVMVVRPDGEPVPGASVVLPFVEGAPKATTGEDGIAALSFVARSARRDLLVQVEGTDGNVVRREVELDAETLPAVVRTERTLYTAGDTVKGKVLASSPAGVAFLDVVHDGTTIATHTVPLQASHGDFAIDLPAESTGTVTFYAYLPGKDVKRSRKTLYVGEPRSLRVAINPDAESYRPGKEAKLTLSVTGEDGKPAVANVGVSVVDESVFALVAKEPALLKAYFLLAEELSKPRYDLDPARVVAEGPARDRAAAMLFSHPRASEIERVGETSPQELETRRASLLARQGAAATTGWGFGLLLLGVIFEGALRFLFEKLFGGFFRNQPWRIAALVLGGGLGLLDKLNGGSETTLIAFSVAPLLFVLAVQAAIRLARASRALFYVSGTALALCGAGFFLFTFTPQVRALFAVSANALGGDAAQTGHAGSAYAKSRKRNLGNFNQRNTTDGVGYYDLPFAGGRGGEGGGIGGLATGGGGGRLGDSAGVGALGAKTYLPSPEKPGGAKFDLPKLRVLKDSLADPVVDKTRVRVRSWFPETMFWSPGVITGADGRATLTLPMADSITSWRVSATASGADGRLGVGGGALRAFQDFFVDLDLPVALTVGDEVEVPVAVHNYLAEAQKVRLEVEEAPWFTALSPRVQEVVLEPNEVRGVPLRLRASAFGKQTITVWAFGSKLQDAIRRDVEVRPDGVRVEEAVGGVLGAPVRARTRLPAGTIAGSEKVLLRVYPGLFSAALEGIEGVFRKPTGCFEQTSSATYPNVLVLDWLRRNRQAKPDVEARAIEYIQQGYQRLLSFETSDGGFEWFGRAPANKVLTAYGLLEFADMARVYAVDPEVIRRTQSWLVWRQGPDGAWEPDSSSLRDGLYRDSFAGRYGTTAYIAWALLESGYRGEATYRALSFLSSRAGEVTDGYTLSLVANALLAGGRDADRLLERLEAQGVEIDRKVRFPSGGRTAVYSAGNSADVETTSLAVLALTRSGRTTKVQAALDWLLSQRDAHGACGSTQATVLALRTLLSSGAAGQDAVANAEVAIRIGAEQVEKLEIRPESADLVRTIDLTRFAKPGEPLEVELAMTGTARAQYQLVTLAWVPKPRPEEALTLAVDFDRLTLAPDDTLTARARATWKRAGPSGMVMLALGIPPGFEIDSGSVGALVAAGKVGKFTITGKELLLYVDRLEPGVESAFEYKLRARYPVKAKAPASLAYLYYQPEVKAESAPVGLVVQR